MNNSLCTLRPGMLGGRCADQFRANASIQHDGTLGSHRKVENRLAHRGDAIVWRTDQALHDAGKRGQFHFTGIALRNYSQRSAVIGSTPRATRIPNLRVRSLTK